LPEDNSMNEQFFNAMLKIKEEYSKEVLLNKVDKEILIEKHVHTALDSVGLKHDE